MNNKIKQRKIRYSKMIAIVLGASILGGCNALSSIPQLWNSTIINSTPCSALNESSTIASLREEAVTISDDTQLKASFKKDDLEKYQGLLDAIPTDFTGVREPYILYSVINYQFDNYEDPSYYLIQYSGGDTVDENAINHAATLIYAHLVFTNSQHFVEDAGGGHISLQNQVTVRAYSVDIYYYDVASKNIIGYDRIAAPSIPDRMRVSGSERSMDLKPSDNEIRTVIGARFEKE